MQRILENYDMRRVLEMRKFSKTVQQEVVPRCIKHLIYNCPMDEEDEKAEFFKDLKYASKVEIKYINGSEEHLQKVKEIADNNADNCSYLYLGFYGEDENEFIDENVAKKYVDQLARFKNITMLKVEVEEEANFSNICKIINQDDNFPWFNKVTVVKCYEARSMKEPR